jgi:O-methyltransferase
VFIRVLKIKKQHMNLINFFNRLLNKIGVRIYILSGIMTNPLDENGIEILKDESFLKSCREVKPYSLLDTNRLINLWEYCKRSNPIGAILEVGSYKGGGALHLSNCQPNRHVYVFESFQGFETIDSRLDANFNMQQFKDTAQANIENLFSERNRKATITPGFFPESTKNISLPNISFVHLDVDIYKATIESLLFLDDKMTDYSFILLDDCRRGCDGVDKAVEDFMQKSKNWIFLPLFPSQGLLVHKSWLK